MKKDTKNCYVVIWCDQYGDHNASVDVDGVFDTFDEAKEFVESYLRDYEDGILWTKCESEDGIPDSRYEHGNVFFEIKATRRKPSVMDVYGEP